MTPVENPTNRLLTRKQAAEILGVLPQTLTNWAFLKRGPVFHRIGRSVRYKLADLEEFIERGRVETRDQQ